MHEAHAHSVVSDALVEFATATLADQHAHAAAASAVAKAREQINAATDTSRQFKALLQSPGATADDTRARGWVIGATLATQAAASPSTPVIAAVIAIGEALGASTDEIAAAAAVGIEAAARLLKAVDSAEFRARWNVSSSVGVLGAALAVARLLKLDGTQTGHALGIAATEAAGLARNSGQTMEAIETGKAAADAIEAALLAKHGFTSAPASIDGRRGFAALMAYRFDAAAITDDLGIRWISHDNSEETR
jgi:2-methylcitrate dehydratase PrpD